MTAKEAIAILQSRLDLIKKAYPDISNYAEALEMAIEALNQFAEDSKKVSSSCGQENDLISKASVCEILADVFPTDGEKVVYVEEIEIAYQEIIALPYAQPETAKRIVGKSRDGMTLWYQCDMCNEPVDAQDDFCRGCGRRLIDE